MEGSKLKRVLVVAVVLLVVGMVGGWLFVYGGMIYSSLFAYPSPEYQLESYDQLKEKMEAAEESYYLPPAALVQEQGYENEYTVWLKDRFHDDPGGYLLYISSNDDGTAFTQVDCRLISEMYEQAPVLTPTEEYKGIELQSSEAAVQFIMEGCLYTISAEGAEQAAQIAKGIIDNAK